MPEAMRLSDYFDKMYSTHDRYWWREPGRHWSPRTTRRRC
jgi:hypothetical protein